MTRILIIEDEIEIAELEKDYLELSEFEVDIEPNGIKGLEKALEDRPDLKYITDVAPDNYAALREKFGLRVFATPKKMGAPTAEANMNAGLAAARQIVDYFATGNTKFQVNK